MQTFLVVAGVVAALNLFYAVYLAYVYYAPMTPTRWTYHLRVRWWWVPSVKHAAFVFVLIAAAWALWLLMRGPLDAERSARIAAEQATLELFAQQQAVIRRLDRRLQAIERPEFFLPATAKRGA